MLSELDIGTIYYMGRFPNGKPRLMKILHIYFDPAYQSKVMKYITNENEEHLDRYVFTRYYRPATQEEILLYWPRNEKNAP